MKSSLFIIAGFGLIVVSPSGWSLENPSSSSGQDTQNPVTSGAIPLKGSLPDDKAPSSPQQHSLPAFAGNNRQGRLVLGIQVGEVGPELKAQLGLNGFSGVLVEDVVKDGPAAKAGIHKFDIILKVAGRQIQEFNDIREAFANAGPGDKVEVEILRSNKPVQLELVLDKDMRARDIPQLQAVPPLKPVSPDHIRRAIGAGRIPMPDDMCGAEDMIAMLGMMSELVDHSRAWNNQAMVLERVDRMRRLTDQMHRQLNRKDIVFESSVVMSSNSSSNGSNFSLRDAKGVIELKTDPKNGTRLLVKDTNGQVIFDGPYATEADRSKVPDAVKQRMDGVCIHLQTR